MADNGEVTSVASGILTIDGSQGEGGGQVLRSALALSSVTGKPFVIERIRAGRKKPGLMRQHMTAVAAAAEVSQADMEGNAIGSSRLMFHPGMVMCAPGPPFVLTCGAVPLGIITRNAATAQLDLALFCFLAKRNRWIPIDDWDRLVGTTLWANRRTSFAHPSPPNNPCNARSIMSLRANPSRHSIGIPDSPQYAPASCPQTAPVVSASSPRFTARPIPICTFAPSSRR
jgi:hypothetical protein